MNSIEMDYFPALKEKKKTWYGTLFFKSQRVLIDFVPPFCRLILGLITFVYTGRQVVRLIDLACNIFTALLLGVLTYCLIILLALFMIFWFFGSIDTAKEPDEEEVKKLLKLRREQGEEAFQQLKEKELKKLKSAYKRDLTWAEEAYKKRRAEFLYAGKFHLMMQYEMMHLSKATNERIAEVLKQYGYDFFEGKDEEFGKRIKEIHRSRNALFFEPHYITEELQQAQTKEIDIDETIECFKRMFNRQEDLRKQWRNTLGLQSVLRDYNTLGEIIPVLESIKRRGGIKNMKRNFVLQTWVDKSFEWDRAMKSVIEYEQKEVERLYAIDSARSIKALEYACECITILREMRI